MKHYLDGHIITGMKIADDKQAILFLTDKGDVIAKADGDCCSKTWIEHIELPAMGFPATVTSVDDLNMPDLGQPDEFCEITYYGLKIITDKGEIIIDYRNESNGYYGGNLVFPDEYYYGGVWGQNKSTENWIEITE